MEGSLEEGWWDLKWGKKQLRWKTRDPRWIWDWGGRGNFGGLFRGEGPSASHSMGTKSKVYSATPSSRLQGGFNRLCIVKLTEEVLCEGSARRCQGCWWGRPCKRCRIWRGEGKSHTIMVGLCGVLQGRAGCVTDACPPGWDRHRWEIGSRSEVNLAWVDNLVGQ